jgi:hypothetical protein
MLFFILDELDEIFDKTIIIAKKVKYPTEQNNLLENNKFYS